MCTLGHSTAWQEDTPASVASFTAECLLYRKCRGLKRVVPTSIPDQHTCPNLDNATAQRKFGAHPRRLAPLLRRGRGIVGRNGVILCDRLSHRQTFGGTVRCRNCITHGASVSQRQSVVGAGHTSGRGSAATGALPLVSRFYRHRQRDAALVLRQEQGAKLVGDVQQAVRVELRVLTHRGRERPQHPVGARQLLVRLHSNTYVTCWSS